jgi:hypothetical protein
MAGCEVHLYCPIVGNLGPFVDLTSQKFRRERAHTRRARANQGDCAQAAFNVALQNNNPPQCHSRVQ